MSTKIKNRYSDQELAEFKTLIEEKIVKANEDLELLKSAYMNDGNNGTWSCYRIVYRVVFLGFEPLYPCPM